MNRRGAATADSIDFIVGVFAFVIILGAFVYAFHLVRTSVGQDVMIGSVNLSNATDQTLGRIDDAILDKINMLGIMVLFGMVLAMMVNAYFTRNQYPKLFIVLDILIVFVGYVISAYLSNAYETLITTLPFGDTYTTYLAKPSQFLLNLPIWTVIIGIIIMIISYSDIPRNFKDEVFVGQS